MKNLYTTLVVTIILLIIFAFSNIANAQNCPDGMSMVTTLTNSGYVTECKTVANVVQTDNTVTCATEGYIMKGDICEPPTSVTNSNTTPTTPTTPTPTTTKKKDSAISGLIPCDNSTDHPCDFNAFVLFINNVITWFLDLSVIVAMITFAMAGAKMLMNPENAGARSEAIEMFKKTVYGLIIVLTAWLIIHTVISYLVKPDIGALRFLDKTTTAK